MRICAPATDVRVPLETVDLYEPRLYSEGDPHLVWKTLRETAPVFWQDLPDGRGFWSVTRYDDCCRVLADYSYFTSSRGAILKMLGKADPAGGRQMAVSDPPRHTQLRRPLQQLLTFGAMDAHMPRIHAAIRRLLAPMREDSVWDLGEAMTALPMIVSGVLMGLPEQDCPELVRWGLMTVAPDDVEFQVAEGPEATLAHAHHGLFAYFAEQVRFRRRRPTRDLITRLMTMRVDGARLGDGDVIANCYSMLLGANVNTGHTISAAILRLVDDPEQYGRWAGDDAALKRGIREALRWSSPVVHFLRYAVEDTEIRGQRIRGGDGVVAWIPSANRDEAVFPEPYRFDIDRHPNREIAFGYGPHRCIGAPAAQLTLELTLREIFAHVAGFAIAGEVRHLCSNFTGGITHLPVKVQPRSSVRSSSASSAGGPSRNA